MGKKQQDVMAAQRESFIKGCIRNDIDGPTAAKIFDEISYLLVMVLTKLIRLPMPL